jgi:tetratricopeptide (TPR) repeat protein
MDFPMELTNPRLRRSIVTLLILSAGIIVYANTFQAPFVLDDTPSIVNNKAIRSLANFYPHGSGYFLPGRSVAYLSFALNYHFGGLDVTGYHAVNLIIHLISGLLVYALLRLTFCTPFFEDHHRQPTAGPETQPGILSFFASRRSFIPLFAALLFVVHPVQTQSVTYIVQRMTSLAAMFYLLSIVLYVMARLSGERGGSGEREPAEKEPATAAKVRIKPVLLIFGAVLSAVLAMLTKPIAFTLPLAVFLYEFCFFHGALRKRMVYLAPLLATLPVIPLTILGVGGTSDHILLDAGDQLRVGSDLSRLDYLFTQFRVLGTYLRLLVFPVNQTLDYDHPVYSTFFTPPVFFSFLLLAAFFGAALFLVLATRWAGSSSTFRARLPSCLVDPAARLVAFGICWFFLALSVESSFVPIVDVLVEHRLYLPSVGIAAAFAAALYLLAGNLSRPIGAKLLALVSLALVMTLGFATWQRNHVWGNAVRLWTDVVEKSPNKGRASNNLGVALEQAGRRTDAFRMMSRAIEVEPGYYKAYYNLADLYLIGDRPDDALPLLQAAIRLQPQFTEAYVKLGAALMRGGRFRDVIAFLEQNLDRVKEEPEARFYLGAAYAFLGNRQAAMRELDMLTRFDSAFAATLSGLLGSKSNHGFIHGSN